ncbi:MAG: HypC/HybG/HupF family hydrogenase formation chaperone [Chloroflexi bacterium]|nr:HypC/HybG/HupF family hydrogenase formation chaperone [Chloroflexota bacterium]
MCQAVPAQITRVEGATGWVVQNGREQPVALIGLDGIAAGDWVYHQAGLALARIEPDEAAAILALLDELDALYQREMEESSR